MIMNLYPLADPSHWLRGDCKGLDAVFSGRLAYYAMRKGVQLHVTSGYRSSAEQSKLYQQYLEYRRTGRGPVRLAARPGTSKHEYHIAADISTKAIRGATNSELLAFGLHKPIIQEPWHVEPIETKNNSKWRNLQLREEDENVRVDRITVAMNGKETQIESILYKGENYMRIRSLADAQRDDKLTVDYDVKRRRVIIKSR